MEKNVRIAELLEYLKEGRMDDAQMEFFADDVVTQEGNGELIKGKANAAEELQKLRKQLNMKRFVAYDVTSVASNDTDSFYAVTLSVEVNDGEQINIEQVVHNKWENGKIVFERYYHQ